MLWIILDLIDKADHVQNRSFSGAFRDTNLRSLLTNIATAVDDPFPLVYGLVYKNIINDQLLNLNS